MKNQYNNSFEKKNSLSVNPNTILYLLYINHLLLLLILNLVAKSFSTSYKELPSATNRVVEESMNGGNMQTPLATLLS
jgi:hypothetical protein